jgi:uncharacterized membrane protein YfcA
MLFPTAGIEVSPWIPPLVAFAISFFTSMGGVSGAFLLLPFQMSILGYTTPSVSATNQVFNILAIPSGVYRYCREGRMVWPLTWIVIAGTLPGVFLGAVVRVAFLPDPKRFKLFAAAVLFYIGIKMAWDLLRKRFNDTGRMKNGFRSGKTGRPFPTVSDSRPNGTIQLPNVKVTHFNFLHLRYTFDNDAYDVSFWGIFSLCFLVGIVGGIYGIGGGSIIAPFFITIFGLPVHTVAGAALMGTFVTSVAGVAFYQMIAPLYPETSVAPDWLLGILFGLGGMVGMYLGARCQKYVSASVIKWMLAGIIIFTGVKYAADFF